MGLALITPISGFVCYKLGQYLDQRMGSSWIAIVGLIVGCAAGMYETYRQGLNIEGIDALISNKPQDQDDKPE